MAVTYGFYDSLNHDRLYNAQQMSAIFDGIINDGVFMSVGNQFHTVAGTGMQVIVKSGRAWFDSTWTLNDAEYPLSIDAADVLLTRIDAVVLEVNSEVATRANTIKVVKGTPASTPAKPTLTNTATIHQHALAYVTVAKNTTAITNSMIEIVVGKTETPYVTAILQTTDITDLFKKWENQFQNWFDNVRSTLDGDVALNLQNQITTLERSILKSGTKTAMGLPSSAVGDDAFNYLLNGMNASNFYNYVYNEIVESCIYTVPSDIKDNKIFLILFGGGGGGGGGATTSGGGDGGGGGSGYVFMDYVTVNPGDKITVTIGAGGNGGSGGYSGGSTTSDFNGKHGSQGGTTSFGSLASAIGGGGGGGGAHQSEKTRDSSYGGDGGAGGGAGGPNSGLSDSSANKIGNGGNGQMFGGGAALYYGSSTNTNVGKGGNGGKYGGGGKGGTRRSGGTGGQYGGDGGSDGSTGANGSILPINYMYFIAFIKDICRRTSANGSSQGGGGGCMSNGGAGGGGLLSPTPSNGGGGFGDVSVDESDHITNGGGGYFGGYGRGGNGGAYRSSRSGYTGSTGHSGICVIIYEKITKGGIVP